MEATNRETIFTATPKQAELYRTAMQAARTGSVRTIGFGGAAGGGKSYGTAAVMFALAMQYPGSRWVIIDSDYTLFSTNLYPTLTRVFDPDSLKYMTMSGANPRAIFKNGSEILFKNENIRNKPNGENWLGLEVNGAWIEQAERISRKTFEMVQSRLGSRWKVKSGPNPYPVMICTMNPTDSWPKDVFHDPHVRGQLPQDHAYIVSKVFDNPDLANDDAYMAGFNYLDPITRSRLLDGDWDAFEKENRFAYAFTEAKHVRPVAPIEGWPTVVSFDFNVDPLAFVIIQAGPGFINVLSEHQAERKSDDKVKAACEQVRLILHNIKAGHVTVTGDASGNKGDLRSLTSTYEYIQQHLALNYTQMAAPKQNMGLQDSWTLVNTVLSCEEVNIDPSCKTLIREMKQVERYKSPTSPSHSFQIRKDRNQYKADHFDAFRYGIHHVRNYWKPPIG